MYVPTVTPRTFHCTMSLEIICNSTATYIGNIIYMYIIYSCLVALLNYVHTCILSLLLYHKPAKYIVNGKGYWYVAKYLMSLHNNVTSLLNAF